MTDKEIYKLASEIHKEAFTGVLTRFMGSKLVGNILSKSPLAGEVIKPLTSVEGATHQTKRFFGLGKSVSAVSEVVKPNIPNATVVDKVRNFAYNSVAEPIMRVKEIQRDGLSKFMADDFKRHTHFTKTDDFGVTRQYERSLAGKILNYGTTSGPGFAAQNLVFRDPNEPLHKTLGRSAFEGALFTMAPRIGGAYYGAQFLKNIF